MGTLTIRNSDETLAESLRRESQRRGESINKLVLDALQERFGRAAKRRCFDDLAGLAGTWSEEDLEEFNRATADFDRIDSRDWT